LNALILKSTIGFNGMQHKNLQAQNHIQQFNNDLNTQAARHCFVEDRRGVLPL
jgi:hypothetical protein